MFVSLCLATHYNQLKFLYSLNPTHNYRSKLNSLQSECQQLKQESREAGRILFDENEDAREDCMKGLVEVKKKLLVFNDMIEYLDTQAAEARKVVFDKNNQIGKYFNQVQEYKKQVDVLSKYEIFLRVKILLL